MTDSQAPSLRDPQNLAYANTSQQGLVLLGREWNNGYEFLSFLRQHASEHGEEMTSSLIIQSSSEIHLKYKEAKVSIDSFLTDFLDVCEEVCPVTKDKKWWIENDSTAIHSDLLAIRKRQREYRKTNTENRQDKISQTWGDAGLHLISLGLKGKNKTGFLNALADARPAWTDAVHFLNRAVFERRKITGKGRGRSLKPTQLDIQAARDLAQAGGSPPVITEEELQELAQATSSTYGYNEFGLLSYRGDTSDIHPSLPQDFTPGYASTIEGSPTRLSQRRLTGRTELLETPVRQGASHFGDRDSIMGDDSLTGTSSVRDSSAMYTNLDPFRHPLVPPLRVEGRDRTIREMTTDFRDLSVERTPGLFADTQVATDADHTGDDFNLDDIDASDLGLDDGKYSESERTTDAEDSGDEASGQEYTTVTQQPETGTTVNAAVNDTETGGNNNEVTGADDLTLGYPIPKQPETGATNTATETGAAQEGAAQKEAAAKEAAAKATAAKEDTAEKGATGDTDSKGKKRRASHTPNTQPLKKRRTKDCDCEPSFTLKDLQALNSLESYSKKKPEQERKAIKVFHNIAPRLRKMAQNTSRRPGRMCSLHMKQLASAVNLQIKNVPETQMILRFAKCTQNAATYDAWNKNNVNSRHRASWFRHGKAPLTVQTNVLYPFRTAVVSKTPFIAPQDTSYLEISEDCRMNVLRDILDKCNISTDVFKEFHRNGFSLLHDIFQWWMHTDDDQDESLITVANEELAMYEHHLKKRVTEDYNTDPDQIFYEHSLTQQLMAVDPVLWIILQCTRPTLVHSDNANQKIDPRTVAVPWPAIHIRKTTEVQRKFVHHDHTWKSPSPLYVIVSLNETADPLVTRALGVGTATHRLTELRDFIHDELQKPRLHTSLPQSLSSEEVDQFHSLKRTSYPLLHPSIGVGSAMILDGVTPFLSHFVPPGHKQGRVFAFQLCFTYYHEGGIITQDELEKSRGNLQALMNDNGEKLVVDDEYHPPPWMQRLNTFDELSKAILAHEPWNAGAESIAVFLLLNKDRDAVWNYILNWRKVARMTLLKQWSHTKLAEAHYYQERAWQHNGMQPSDDESDEEIRSVYRSPSETDLEEIPDPQGSDLDVGMGDDEEDDGDEGDDEDDDEGDDEEDEEDDDEGDDEEDDEDDDEGDD